MSLGIRQRGTSASPAANDQDSTTRRQSPTGISAPHMLQASPQFSGPLLKLHKSPLLNVLPLLIQNILIRCFWFLRPVWKERFGICCGSYFYKFRDEKSSSPKGSPCPLEDIDVNMIDDSDIVPDFESLPNGYSVFLISSFRKRTYYAASRSEALLWVSTLRESKHEAMKRSMGHVEKDSFPQLWTYYDVLGRSMVASKSRVRAKLQELEMRELSEEGMVRRGVMG